MEKKSKNFGIKLNKFQVAKLKSLEKIYGGGDGDGTDGGNSSNLVCILASTQYIKKEKENDN